MANEAVYHKGCHANYIRIKEKVPQSERDAAFAQFLEQVEPNLRERSELTREGGGPVTLKKSGLRNMMTPINVSSFFYDPLKLEDQKAVTLP